MQQPYPPPPPASDAPNRDKDDHGGRLHVSQYWGANTLPQGLVVPLFPAKPNTPTFPLGRAPFACLQCGALANPFCRVEEGAEEWTCAFCAAVNIGRFDRGARGGALPPEFAHQEVELRGPLLLLSGRHGRGRARTLSSSAAAGGGGGGGGGGAAGVGALDASLSSSVGTAGGGVGGGKKAAAPGLVLVIDRNASTKEEAAALVAAIEATLRDPRLDPLTPVSLLLVGGAVTLYRVGQFGGRVTLPFVLRSDALDSAVSGANRERLTSLFQRGEYWVPLHAGREHLLLSLKNMLTDGTFRFSDNDDAIDSSDGHPERFVGTAIDALSQCYPVGRRAQVCVFVTGAPWGPGDELREEQGAATMPTDVARPQERRRYWAKLSRGARLRGLALDVFCLGLPAHLDAPSLHLLVAQTGGAVLLYASAQDPELALDLAKVLFRQPLPPPPDQPATLEIRISSHMEVASVLLPPDMQFPLDDSGFAATTTTAEGGDGARSRSNSSYYAVAEEGGGLVGGVGGAVVSGGRAVVGGVASALGGLASAVGSWLTARGPLLGEGEEFEEGDVGGVGASLKEGWALLHAKEAAQGKPLTPVRHPYWAGTRRLPLPPLRLAPSSSCADKAAEAAATAEEEGEEGVDVALLYRPRDTVLGIWGARPDEFVVQCVLRYAAEAEGEGGGGRGLHRVTRVVTERIHSKMTTREHAPLTVLAVKRAVADVMRKAPAGDTSAAAAEARAGIEAVVREIRSLYPSRQHFTRSKDGFGRPCGTEFARELERLYQAHRGPLLGFHMQGEDTRFTLRHRFLAAGTDAALRLISPTCLSVGPLGLPGNSPSLTQPDAATLPRLRPWPCQTMGLWSNVILVMDMQDRLVIWIGREAAYMLWSAAAAASDGQTLDPATAAYAAHQGEAERALAACRAYAARARAGRFPTPQVLEVQEDDPLERFVLARVIPSHKDTPKEMLAGLPRLRDLPPGGREALRCRFASLSTDEPSLQQFLRRNAPVAGPAPAPNPYYTGAR